MVHLRFMVHHALPCTRPPPSSPCGYPSRQGFGGRGPRLATLVIRRPSDAADEGDVTTGRSRAPVAPAHRPGWTVAFFSFGDAAPAWTASRVFYFMVHHALSCTRPPPSSPCGIPSRQDVLGDEDQDTYKRRRRATEQRAGFLVRFWLGFSLFAPSQPL